MSKTATMMALYEQGILCAPCAPKSKVPFITYAHWREKRVGEKEYEEIWRTYEDADVLMLTSPIESIDLDQKNVMPGTDDNLLEIFMENLGEILGDSITDLLPRLYIECTPSGGWHIMYRARACDSKCLARRPVTEEELLFEPKAKAKTLVDLLASGKLCKIFPSVGYTIISGEPYTFHEVSEHEQAAMQQAAMMMNKWVDEESEITFTPRQPNEAYGSADRPGDRYNKECPIRDTHQLLLNYGWKVARTSGKRIYYTRPGKQRGISASLDQSTHVFFNFSNSVSEFGTERGYSPFRVFAILKHHGDFESAAKEAMRLYPLPADQRRPIGSKPIEAHQLKQSDADIPVEADDVSSVFADMPPSTVNFDPPPWWDDSKFVVDDDTDCSVNFSMELRGRSRLDKYGIAAKQMITVFSGKAKSRKSTVLGVMVASALSGKDVGPFNPVEYKPNRCLYVDTEQATYWVKRSYEMIKSQCATFDKDLFKMLALRPLDHKKKKEAILYALDSSKPDYLIVDGVADLVKDTNSLDEASEMAQFLMTLSTDYNLSLVTVLHVNPSSVGEVKMRGHLGTVMTNKADFSAHVELDSVAPDYASVISCKFSRGKKFEPILAKVDNSGKIIAWDY